MKLIQTGIDGLVLVESRIFEDSRGHFLEVYKEPVFESLGLSHDFVQDNVSVSHKGVVRGLHYQIEPMAQAKLVRCLQGSVFDVAVDVRKNSPTFGHWFGVTLKPTQQALFIPAGFAHGFQALEANSMIYYKCTTIYSPTHEKGIRYDDSDLSIKWPIPPGGLSDKDLILPRMRDLV
jgi:dTDP-4-dehydrorhamnose 3,5-epimerase